jgi:precorrin-6B methylase 2
MTPGQLGLQMQSVSAELYERLLVPTVTLPWARDLVERVGLRRGDRVLDVACGTGVVARLAASAVGDGGRVAALDVDALAAFEQGGAFVFPQEVHVALATA